MMSDMSPERYNDEVGRIHWALMQGIFWALVAIGTIVFCLFVVVLVWNDPATHWLPVLLLKITGILVAFVVGTRIVAVIVVRRRYANKSVSESKLS